MLTIIILFLLLLAFLINEKIEERKKAKKWDRIFRITNLKQYN